MQRSVVGNQEVTVMLDYDYVAAIGSGQDFVCKDVMRPTLRHLPVERHVTPEEFEDLMLLQELDKKGRVPGAIVCELAEALAYIKALADEDDG